MTQTKALRFALETITRIPTHSHGVLVRLSDAEAAIKAALETNEFNPDWDAMAVMVEEQQRMAKRIEELEAKDEPVTILPDGSAFGVMTFPLPKDHWIYAPNEYKDGEDEPIDLPKTILTHAMRDAVIAAVRYAVRGATIRGQENDFDPDALVQNAVYALCGPYGKALEQQPADEPVAWVSTTELLVMRGNKQAGAKDWRINVGLVEEDGDVGLYTRPQPAAWVGLTDEDWLSLGCKSVEEVRIGLVIEAALRSKNG